MTNPIEEDKEYIDITKKNKSQKEQLRQQITLLQQKNHEQYKPYCFRCAYLDIQEEQARIWKNKGTTAGAKNQDDTKVALDLEKYSEPSRFKKIGESPIKETKLLDGIKIWVEQNKYIEYSCKERGCRISIQTPIKN